MSADKQRIIPLRIALPATYLCTLVAGVTPAAAQTGPDGEPTAAPPVAPATPDEPAAPSASPPADEPAATDDEGSVVDEFIEPSFLPEPGLEQYVSVSTKITQTVEETPASVFVIDRQQIDAAAYRSVGEALAFAPGLYVSYDLLNYHVGVRGIFGGSRSGSRTLKVMINGRPVAFVQSGTYLLGPEFIPMSLVERIEVMRGPASALYGTGALEGAINIVTRRPPYEGEITTGGQVDLYGGSPSNFAAGADAHLTVTGERFFALVGANVSYADRSGLTLPDDSFFRNDPRFMDPDGNPRRSKNDIAQPRSFFARFETRLAGGRFDASAVAQFQDRTAEFHDLTVFSSQLGDELGEQAFDTSTRINLYNVHTGASYEKPFASGFAVRTRAGASFAGPMSGDRFFIGNTTPLGLEPGRNLRYTRDFSSTEYAAAVELLREFGERGLALVGIDGSYAIEELQQVTEFDALSGNVTVREKPEGHTITNAAAFAQVLYPVNPRITVAGGLRFDISNIHGGTVTGRIASVFRPRDDLFIKLMAGRAFKAPSAEQLYGSPITDGDVAGEDGLPEQFINGVEATVSYFVLPSLEVSLTGFFNTHQDALSNLLRGGRLVATSFDSRTLGGEVAIQHSKEFDSGLRTDFSLLGSIQDTRTPLQEAAGGITEKPVPDNEIYPRVMATALANVRVKQLFLNTHLAFRHVGERIPSQSNLLAAGTVVQDNPIYTLPPYNVLDVAVSSMPIPLETFGRLVGTVKVENVLDARYSEIGFNGIDVPNLGRVAWVWARLEF